MAIREKAKALFKSKSKSDRDSQLSKSSTNASDRDRWPSNVYKPGEAMPRPKYRTPPKKEHKEKLEAFSFAEAWRRKSLQSQYSPMGTRAPSRRGSSRQQSRRSSWISMGRKSFSGKSSDGGTTSITSGDTEKSNVRQREHLHAARAPGLQTEAENVEGDDDVANVGLSRVHSRDHNPHESRPTTAEGPNGSLNGITKTITAHDHQPFTEDELALALKKSHLAVPVH